MAGVILGLCMVLLGSCAAQEPVRVVAQAGGFYDIRQGALVRSGLKLLAAAETAPEAVRIYGSDNGSETAQRTGAYCDIGSDLYLVVMRNGNPLLLPLDKSEGYRPQVFARDMDGDGEDEIVVLSLFYGWKITGLRIFKAEKKGLTPLYCCPDFPFDGAEDDPYACTDFGFSSELLEDYRLRLTHGATGFETIVPISGLAAYDAEQYYDAEGKLVAPANDVIRFGGFSGVELMDADGDGVWEVAGTLSAGFGYKQTVGTAEVLMKYNRQSRQMEIVHAAFTA